MNRERLMQIILAPVITEKATQIADKYRQITFRVQKTATKSEIKAAVELLFQVQVDDVQVLNRMGKQKRFGRFIGRRSDTRKAYVSLKEGYEIDFSEVK